LFRTWRGGRLTDLRHERGKVPEEWKRREKKEGGYLNHPGKKGLTKM